MMKRAFRYLLAPVFALGLLAGCDGPAPVALVDPEIGTPGVELLSGPSAPTPILAMNDLDTSGTFPADPRRAFAQLLIAGSTYDGLFLHTESTLARGIFFDRSRPVLNIIGDTAGYNTIDVGSLTVDGYALLKHPKHLLLLLTATDTVLGPQYSLRNSAGSGITFDGGRSYHWQNPASTLPSPIDVAIQTPPVLVVTRPLASAILRLDRNLTTRWTGGDAVIMIVVSDVRDAGRPKPLVRMRVRANRGYAVIPREILGLLPAGRAGFLFTFSSERSSMIRVDGYADDVLLQGTTSHSLYLQCSP